MGFVTVVVVFFDNDLVTSMEVVPLSPRVDEYSHYDSNPPLFFGSLLARILAIFQVTCLITVIILALLVCFYLVSIFDLKVSCCALLIQNCLECLTLLL